MHITQWLHASYLVVACTLQAVTSLITMLAGATFEYETEINGQLLTSNFYF